jgi:predicted ferric reductase
MARPAVALRTPTSAWAPGLVRRWGAGATRFALASLALVNVAAIVALWLHGGGVTDVHGLAEALTSAGRLTALLGGYLALGALLLLARIPFLERVVGFGRLTRWHRHTAVSCLALVLAHVALTTAGLTLSDRVSVLREADRLISQYPGVITATAGVVLLVVVAVSSAAVLRRLLRYESWYFVHLYAYLAIALAYSHQIATGKDFVGAPAARAYWLGLYLGALVLLVLFRLVQPLGFAARHRLRVDRVVQEGPEVVSIEITGRRIDRLKARPGQFFLWRFLTPARWFQAHPFSLSAAPDGRRLRITVGAAGDFSAELGTLAKGTRVLAEGPFGVFTPEARRRVGVALIADGTGITAVRALLETMSGDVELIYRPRDPDAILFREEVEELATARGAGVHYVDRGEPGFSPELLVRLVPDIAQRDAFVCGSRAMVRAVRASLRELGVSHRQMFSEEFGD